MSTFTICFCGTSCWPDEGITDHPDEGSYKHLYGPAGYIPAKIHQDIEIYPDEDLNSWDGRAVLPGPGVPYVNYASSGRLLLHPLPTLPYSLTDTALGKSMPNIAFAGAASIIGVATSGRAPERLEDANDPLSQTIINQARSHIGLNLQPGERGRTIHPADPIQFNKAAINSIMERVIRPNAPPNPIEKINLIGHSRGAVAAILCAHELAYLFPGVPVNIFAMDPVPGPGTLPDEIVKLPSNVANYVGVYVLDETSWGFNAVVPWPQNTELNPLENPPPGTAPAYQDNYHLIYVPGRHATVAGNKTEDGAAGAANVATERVGILVDYLARACLNRWGTEIEPTHATNYPDRVSLAELKATLTEQASVSVYRQMRAHRYPYVGDNGGWLERLITSWPGTINTNDVAYLENSIGFPQPLVAHDVVEATTEISNDRPNKGQGRIRWTAIQDLADRVFDQLTADPELDRTFDQH